MVKGGGHGDYRQIVLAPATIQELIDFTVEAFDIAEKYRCIVVVLADGSLGQMMEPAELPPMQKVRKLKDRPDWALTGAKDRDPNIISSIYIDPSEEEVFNLKLVEKYKLIEANEIRFKEMDLDDAEMAVVAFGTAGRISQSAIRQARQDGLKVGLFRPISLYPFPFEAIAGLAAKVKRILVVEMNGGQMVDDVRLALEGKIPVDFYGRMGGVIPLPDEVYEQICSNYDKID
jgi:2-oxoglutarate ferredoxin oxidoreductase subunit alpha